MRYRYTGATFCTYTHYYIYHSGVCMCVCVCVCQTYVEQSSPSTSSSSTQKCKLCIHAGNTHCTHTETQWGQSVIVFVEDDAAVPSKTNGNGVGQTSPLMPSPSRLYTVCYTATAAACVVTIILYYLFPCMYIYHKAHSCSLLTAAIQFVFHKWVSLIGRRDVILIPAAAYILLYS